MRAQRSQCKVGVGLLCVSVPWNPQVSSWIACSQNGSGSLLVETVSLRTAVCSTLSLNKQLFSGKIHFNSHAVAKCEIGCLESAWGIYGCCDSDWMAWCTVPGGKIGST